MLDYVSKKTGPKPKPAAEYRSHRVSIYLTDDEFDHVHDVLKLETSTHNSTVGRAMADHFRRSSAHQEPAKLPAPAVNLVAWQELARLAGNLNQLAKNANSGRITGINSQQIDDLAAAVEVLRNDLLGLL